jgi:GNAT superfamily N-acetyltransferase
MVLDISPAVAVRATTVADLCDRCCDLMRANWAEVAPAGLPFELDNFAYETLETNGSLFVLVAEWDGRPIGYAVACLTRNLKSVRTIVCHVDAVFVLAEHRRTGAGLALVDAITARARECGAHSMHWVAQRGSAFERVLEGKGMEPMETVYRQVL